jgi:hypothetical protein
MGRKGVSKRKPKKSVTSDNRQQGASNSRAGESSSSVQALVSAKEAPLSRGSTNPSAAGSNKKNRKGR